MQTIHLSYNNHFQKLLINKAQWFEKHCSSDEKEIENMDLFHHLIQNLHSYKSDKY